jgi:hypothetical protein
MGNAAVTVDRERVMAYRLRAHQLHRVAEPAARLAVLDLGVQDVGADSAKVALAARTAEDLNDADLALVWATRGAPHLLRRADAAWFAAALWPLSDADATARIVTTSIKEGARLGLAAFEAAAKALRDVVTGPMPKGEVSAAVSARVPRSLTYDCTPCRARHISGLLFQQVGAAAGVRVVPRGNATTLQPLGAGYDIPETAAGTDALITAYLRLHGPATLAEVAKFVGTTQTALRPAWPGGLAEVDLDGRRTWLPADALPALRDAPVPDAVRLLPPMDPLLQARDRDVLVPDADRQKEVWRMLGNPGVVLNGVDVVGTWRAKATKTRLDLTVAAFEPLPDLADEAARVAAARGIPQARVTVG